MLFALQVSGRGGFEEANGMGTALLQQHATSCCVLRCHCFTRFSSPLGGMQCASLLRTAGPEHTAPSSSHSREVITCGNWPCLLILLCVYAGGEAPALTGTVGDGDADEPPDILSHLLWDIADRYPLKVSPTRVAQDHLKACKPLQSYVCADAANQVSHRIDSNSMLVQ